MIERIHSRSGGINVENLTLVEAELDETLAHIDGTVPDLDKVEPPVLGELEELPRLLLRDLLAGHGLLDVLFLLDGVYNVAPAEGVASTVLTGVVEEDVGDGVDPGLGALDEGVGVEGVTADGAVAVRGLGDLDRAIGGELCFVYGGISSRVVRSTDMVASIMAVGEMEDEAEIECGVCGVASCHVMRDVVVIAVVVVAVVAVGEVLTLVWARHSDRRGARDHQATTMRATRVHGRPLSQCSF